MCVCVCVCVCRPPLFSLSAIARVCFVRVCNNETRGRTERIQVGKKKKKVLVLAKKVLGAKKTQTLNSNLSFKPPVVVVVGDTTATTFAVMTKKNDGE